MMILQVTAKFRLGAGEPILAYFALPQLAVKIDLVLKPVMLAFEHVQFALGVCADIRSQIAQDVFSKF